MQKSFIYKTRQKITLTLHTPTTRGVRTNVYVPYVTRLNNLDLCHNILAQAWQLRHVNTYNHPAVLPATWGWDRCRAFFSLSVAWLVVQGKPWVM